MKSRHAFIIKSKLLILLLASCANTGDVYLPNESLLETKTAKEIVEALYLPFNLVKAIFHDGGLRVDPFVIYEGEVVYGNTPIKYEGRYYAPVNDERFPYIRTIEDARNKVQTVFTISFAQRYFSSLFGEEKLIYRDIDGMLHRAVFVELPDALHWKTDYIKISNLAIDKFVATVFLCSTQNEGDFSRLMDLHLKLTQDGWRVDNMSFRFIEH
ncbi:MAG: hypothetical protein FWB92_12280 [Oscillospiraceae bacterium]|nr:hypothetical protein [Oscillospiraceae bacterium]